ncbi:MAG: gamma carbonic anhydrase family protein [Pseudomonadota bacterium]
MTEARFGPLVRIDPSAWVHPTAQLYGKISLGPRGSVWPNAVIRSELHEVEIGEGSNIQDFVMIHVGYDHPVRIGRFCSVTHHATIHGATLEDHVLIGINATVMDGAVIGAGSVVAGNALVREGSQIPPHSIAAGVPAKVIATRDMTQPNLENAEFYMGNARAYAQDVHRMDQWESNT